MICPADHKHGNATCYSTHRCRCEPCRAWRREWIFNHEHPPAMREDVMILHGYGFPNSLLADMFKITTGQVQRVLEYEGVAA